MVPLVSLSVTSTHQLIFYHLLNIKFGPNFSTLKKWFISRRSDRIFGADGGGNHGAGEKGGCKSREDMVGVGGWEKSEGGRVKSIPVGKGGEVLERDWGLRSAFFAIRFGTR